MLIKRFLAVLLLLILAGSFVSPAAALTSSQKETQYYAAIQQLISYMGRYPDSSAKNDAELKTIQKSFEELDYYQFSQSFCKYINVLLKINKSAYDMELDDDIHILQEDKPFAQYLEDNLNSTSIGSIKELTQYKLGRENQFNWKRAKAITAYNECLTFLDAEERYKKLKQQATKDTYEEGVALFNQDDLAGAYMQFITIPKYKNSAEYISAIKNILCYIPKSATDNPQPVTDLKISKQETTQLTVSWKSAPHTKSYVVYYRSHGSASWKNYKTVSKSPVIITGLKKNTSYDIRVVSITGKTENEAVLLNKKTADDPPPKKTKKTSKE